MRKVIIFFIIFYLHSPALWASDLLIGKWKLNVEKSSLGVVGENMKESIEVYREIGNNMIELSSTELLKDGSTESSEWTWPKEGGVVKRIDEKMPENMLYVQINVKSGHYYVSIMKDGRNESMYHKKVSKDGKTLTQTFKGISREGNQLDIIAIYERQ